MVTTVGTENDIKALLKDFIQLEHDAIAAYDATIERLSNPDYTEKIREFRGDHERHMEELRGLADRHGAYAPDQGDAKQMLTTGKIKIADMAGGDSAILKAMSTNESDTVTAYRRGAENSALPEDDRAIFRRALEDEERHKDWMERTAQAS
jgi:rubrerythrin